MGPPSGCEVRSAQILGPRNSWVRGGPCAPNVAASSNAGNTVSNSRINTMDSAIPACVTQSDLTHTHCRQL
jgi:hypothetical protein